MTTQAASDEERQRPAELQAPGYEIVRSLIADRATPPAAT
jgi:hypothetical protein